MSRFFFFNDTATTEIYTLSLHDALPILSRDRGRSRRRRMLFARRVLHRLRRREAGAGGGEETDPADVAAFPARVQRSEEHTSELQSRQYLVCRLLLEKKKSIYSKDSTHQ